jgi:hypothetical protein
MEDSMRALVPSLLALALLAGSPSAQGKVWVVGPVNADFPQIQPAIDAASDGDVILIRSWSVPYATAAIDGKSLSLIADTDAEVRLGGGLTTGTGLRVRNLGPGQSFFARGLAMWGRPALELDSDQGDVLFEDCQINGLYWSYENLAMPSVVLEPADGAWIRDCASVAFSRCSFTGGWQFLLFGPPPSPLEGGRGIEAVNSGVHLYESEVAAGSGSHFDSQFTFVPGDGGNGINLEGSLLFSGGSSIRGGHGGVGPEGCVLHGLGGDGVVVSSDSQFFHIDTAILAGKGPCLINGAGDGDPIVGPATLLPGTSRAMHADSPLREGELAISTFVGNEGDLVFAMWGVIQDQEFYDFFFGTRVPFPLATAFIGVIPSSGDLLFSLPLGDLPPGMESLTLFSQGVLIPVDAPLLLTNATGVVVLDDAF